MITRKVYEKAIKTSVAMLKKVGFAITPAERERMEVADFGLGELHSTGLQIITYVNTDRCCAKELIMTPHQTCPEHKHPTIAGVPGKEETFRCRWGTVYIYVDGKPTPRPASKPPKGSEAYYTVRKEIRLKAGEQCTMMPDTWHWFQAGPKGAIVSEFSTRSMDETDVFRDPRIKREPEVGDN